MDAEVEPTDEHIAAARLRLALDQKLGRSTPGIVRALAEYGSHGPPRPPGLIIQARLAELGITQAEGARRVGAELRYFDSVAEGRCHITTKFAYRLHQELGIEPLPLLHDQARWELDHLDKDTWPYPAELGDDEAP